jgi:hypothetical protein
MQYIIIIIIIIIIAGQYFYLAVITPHLDHFAWQQAKLQSLLFSFYHELEFECFSSVDCS